jgi:hypothetical protein
MRLGRSLNVASSPESIETLSGSLPNAEVVFL